MNSQTQFEAVVASVRLVRNNTTHELVNWVSFREPNYTTVDSSPKHNVNKSYIKYFCGDELFLSNFYLTPIRWQGRTYPSLEHALQASLCFELSDRLFFTIGTVKDARRLGRTIKRHHTWREILNHVIDDLLEIKFNDPELKQKLIETHRRVIHVGANWSHDYRDLHLSQRLTVLRERLCSGYDYRKDL